MANLVDDELRRPRGQTRRLGGDEIVAVVLREQEPIAQGPPVVAERTQFAPPVRPGEQKRAEQERVGHAEKRGREPDAKRERENGKRRGVAVLAQRPHGRAPVVPEMIQKILITR